MKSNNNKKKIPRMIQLADRVQEDIRRKQLKEGDPYLVTAEVASLFGCSVRHVWSLHRRGNLPEPVRLGRCVRWSRVTLLSWLEQGCPPRRLSSEHPVNGSQNVDSTGRQVEQEGLGHEQA